MKQVKPLRVLVVEDAELPAHVAKMLLEAKGCTVDIATTGEQAIQYCSQLLYALILLDLGLPDIDGFEVAKYTIKHSPNNQVPPIIVLTAHADDADALTLAKEIGINGLLTKPLTPALCDQLLENFVFNVAKPGYFMQQKNK